jgi:hypothetical protein
VVKLSALQEALGVQPGDFEIEWFGGGGPARCAPNPAYPQGIAVESIPAGSAGACRAALPYPAPEIGLYRVECRICGRVVKVTAAGRPDDPNAITLGCVPRRGRVH